MRSGHIRLYSAFIALICIAMLLILSQYPLANLRTRCLTVAASGTLYAATLLFAWNRRVVRWILTLALAAMAFFLMLPGRQPDANDLASSFVQSLNRYTGTNY